MKYRNLIEIRKNEEVSLIIGQECPILYVEEFGQYLESVQIRTTTHPRRKSLI